MKNTVLITGAAAGLGKSLSIECARRGMDLVLADIDQVSTEKLARFLHRSYGVHAVSYSCDLSTIQGCIELGNELAAAGIRLNILINNAGLGGTFGFEERSINQLVAQINLNVVAPTVLSRLFIPNLKSNGDAYVLNVASLAGFFHLAGKQVYGASKAYLLSLSRSLRAEFAERNVSFSVLCPGGMNTNLELTLKHRRCSWFARLSIMQPENVAKFAIDGMLKRKELIIPGLMNRLMLMTAKFIPSSVSNRVSRAEMQRLMAQRA